LRPPPEAANAPSVHSKYLYLSPQVYGDNVVAFGLLRALRSQPDLRILGTDVTLELAGVLGFDRFPIVHLPGGPSAVYYVKRAGFVRAIADFMTLRRALRASTAPGTLVLFGNQRRAGTHRLLQLTAGGFRYDEPEWGTSAYRDRREMLERVFGERIDLPPCALPRKDIRNVLVAQSAREAFREWPPAVLDNVMAGNAARGRQTWLVDPTGRYGTFRARAAEYVGGQPLASGVAALKDADLCITTDSLFLHLAYYLGIPAVALVPAVIARAFYFAPPALLDHRLFLSFDDAVNAERLSDFIDRLPVRPVRTG
jgi:hypothetical protein